MPHHRRAYVPGGLFFFTVVTHRRRRLFHKELNRTLLGEVIRECQKAWPFEMNAIALLPDHLHAIWTLQLGDNEFSGRWSVITCQEGRREPALQKSVLITFNSHLGAVNHLGQHDIPKLSRH